MIFPPPSFSWGGGSLPPVFYSSHEFKLTRNVIHYLNLEQIYSHQPWYADRDIKEKAGELTYVSV